MAQDDGDPVIANGQEALSVSRPKISAGIAAVRTCHSGTTEPTTTADHMLWADTTADVLRQRNAADTGWVNLWQEDGAPMSPTPYAKAASFTVDQPGTYYIDATAGAVVATLPACAAAKGWFVAFVREDASGNSITVQRAGSDTIQGATSVSMPTQYDKLGLFSRGTTNWFKWGGFL